MFNPFVYCPIMLAIALASVINLWVALLAAFNSKLDQRTQGSLVMKRAGVSVAMVALWVAVHFALASGAS